VARYRPVTHQSVSGNLQSEKRTRSAPNPLAHNTLSVTDGTTLAGHIVPLDGTWIATSLIA
jgi:hypothetical protein